MNSSNTLTPPIRFGDFELLPESGELKKRGTRIRLSGQAFDTLVLLVEARGQIVSREELQKALWSDSSFGDFEHGLNAAINRLRGALGDSATDSRYVETVPRRGYRFIHPLIDHTLTTANGTSPATPREGTKRSGHPCRNATSSSPHLARCLMCSVARRRWYLDLLRPSSNQRSR